MVLLQTYEMNFNIAKKEKELTFQSKRQSDDESD